MNSRLSRPLLAAVFSGAFLAGGGLFAAPGYAAVPPPVMPDASESASPSSEPTVTTPTSEPPATSTPTTPTEAPSTTAPTDEPTKPPTSPSAPTSSPSVPTTPPSTPTSPPTTTPPPADTTAPTGAFVPNRWAIWTGQSITVTVSGVADNVSTPEQITRVLTWGDGQSQTLHHTAKNVTHTYTSAGKKPITLTLTDAAGNKRVVKSGGPTVSTPVLKYKLNKSAVWHGEKFVWEMTQVPAGATKVTVVWGDGRATALSPRKQKVTKYYHTVPAQRPTIVAPGWKILKATVYNKYGAVKPLTVGKVAVKNDKWRPVVKLTKPSKSNKAASWKAIKGTATDKGSGIRLVLVSAIIGKSNGTVVCYTAKKKWMTLHDDEEDITPCIIPVKVSKGKYSLALKGTPKGAAFIDVTAGDWSGKASAAPSFQKVLS